MGLDRGNAAPAELVWLAIGLLTGVVNAILWSIALRDLWAVHRARQNGAKRIEARTWVVLHGLLVLAQLIAIGIGAFAALSPPANPGTPTTTLGLVLVAGLIAKQALNMAAGLYLLWRRGRLDKYLDGERARLEGC